MSFFSFGSEVAEKKEHPISQVLVQLGVPEFWGVYWEAMLTPMPRLEPGRGARKGQGLPGWGGGCGGRRSCPSLSVRDELTAQLLFQLHGLFENNVMSFITDNPGKWLLWQPGKRMALANQSQVLPAVPVCSNSPPRPLPSSTWGKRKKGDRGQVEGLCRRGN